MLSGLFTIYGFSALRKELSLIDGARLLLSGWEGSSLQALIGSDADLRLVNQLDQKRIARECAKWLASKAQVRSANAAQNMFLVEDGSQGSFAVHGSSAFTPAGLGEVQSDTPLMNTGINEPETTKQLLSWFNSVWADSLKAATSRTNSLRSWSSSPPISRATSFIS